MKNKVTDLLGIYDLNICLDEGHYLDTGEERFLLSAYQTGVDEKGLRVYQTHRPIFEGLVLKVPDGVTLTDEIPDAHETWTCNDEGIPEWMRAQMQEMIDALNAETEPEPGYRFKVGDKVRPLAGTGRLGQPYMYAVGRVGTVVSTEPRVSYGYKVTFEDADVDYLKNVPYAENELTDKLTD